MIETQTQGRWNENEEKLGETIRLDNYLFVIGVGRFPRRGIVEVDSQRKSLACSSIDFLPDLKQEEQRDLDA